eukprot:290662-Amphidinium_carterae.1
MSGIRPAFQVTAQLVPPATQTTRQDAVAHGMKAALHDAYDTLPHDMKVAMYDPCGCDKVVANTRKKQEQD